MDIFSKMIYENVYEVSNGKEVFIYAPFKDLVARKWIVLPTIQKYLIRLIPNKFDVPQNTLRPTVLELDMSHSCSLNCIYCSVDSNSYDKELKMDFDLAKIAIDSVIKNSEETKDPFSVVFVGKGEPTLNWDVLVKCVQYIRIKKRELSLKGKTIVVTNGVVSPNKARWLAKNIDHIALSWDGDKKIQNLQRPLTNGRESYDIVQQTASIFKEEKAYFEIRSTWTTFNIHQMEEFTKMFVEYRPFELNYQPLLEIGRASSLSISKPSLMLFVERFLKSKKIAQQEGIDVMMPSTETKRLNRKFCHAYEGTGFHLAATGFLTACECVFCENDGTAGKLLTYGKIINGKITVDDRKLEFMKSILVDKIPSCRNCFARWHCAGGCLNTHLCNSDNPLAERKHLECEITKQIILRTLLSNLAKERR